MRAFSPRATDEVKEQLARLAEPADRVGPDAYRAAMARLGELFVATHRDRLADLGGLLLVCTNEDADYLARGVLGGLAAAGVGPVWVACFWNDRATDVGTASGAKVDLAPIVRRYVAPGRPGAAMLVVKSVVASACVVRTNVTELVYDRDPARVLVYAPVVLRGADDRLRGEFAPAVADRFEFYWFAEDDERVGEDVKPGIGGQVYERLGLGTRADKNRYTPALVRERRRLPVPT